MVDDRDGIYGLWPQYVLLEFECQSIRTPPLSPSLNPYIERFFGSLKREVLDRQFLVDSDEIQKACPSYQACYKGARPHQGIDGKVPNRSVAPKIFITDIENMKLEKTPRLDGLITQFSLAA